MIFPLKTFIYNGFPIASNCHVWFPEANHKMGCKNLAAKECIMLQVLVWDHPMSKIISLNQLKQQACQPKMMSNKFVKIHGRMDLEAHSHSVRVVLYPYSWLCNRCSFDIPITSQLYSHKLASFMYIYIYPIMMISPWYPHKMGKPSLL